MDMATNNTAVDAAPVMVAAVEKTDQVGDDALFLVIHLACELYSIDRYSKNAAPRSTGSTFSVRSHRFIFYRSGIVRIGHCRPPKTAPA
jgi:hypothetical protein